MTGFVVRTVPTGIKFDLKAPNGETILTSEVYLTAAACRRGIESVRKNAPDAPFFDCTLQNAPICANPKFELYADRAGCFRFRLRARNGKILAFSEGYRTKDGCQKGIESVRKNAISAQIINTKENHHGNRHQSKN